jgi:hypothetical protein
LPGLLSAKPSAAKESTLRKRDRVTNNKATILKSRTTNLVLILCVQIL